MKIGISSIVTEAKLSVWDGLRAVAEAGFDCVDFSICNYSLPSKPAEESFLMDNWLDFAEKLVEVTQKLNLIINQAHATWGHTTDLSEYIPPEALLYRQMNIAKILGARYLVFHPVLPSKKVETVAEREAYIAYNVKWFSELAEYAGKIDVNIAVENVFADKGNHPEEKLYPFTTADSLLELADKVGSKHLGFCLDTGHANLELGDRIVDLIDDLGSRIKVLHVNENIGRIEPLNKADLHMIPLQTLMKTSNIFRALRKNGFDGEVSLEIVDRSDSLQLMNAQLRCAAEVAAYYRDILDGTV